MKRADIEEKAVTSLKNVIQTKRGGRTSRRPFSTSQITRFKRHNAFIRQSRHVQQTILGTEIKNRNIP